MKVEELRIGNWVIQPQGEKPKQIESIRLHEEEYCCTFRNFHYGTWLSELEPIPITKELLLNCGFKKRSESSCTMILSLGNGDPLTDKSCTSIQWWIGNDYMSICRCGISAFSFKIQNLHQLQNIFYDLTGKELNISL